MEISKIQRNIIETDKKYVVVNSRAAVGKTTTLVERVKYLLNQGVSAYDIVVISFTRAAAEEMYKRLDNPEGLFCGTIHAYANFLLLANGIDTTEWIQNEQYDTLIETVMENPKYTQKVKHLILDEAQDSNALQLSFILDTINPENWMFFGDRNQSIYQWLGAEPDLFSDLSSINPFVTVYDLNENYRNGRSILQFAKEIIRAAGPSFYDNTICKTENIGRVVQMDFSWSLVSNLIQESPDNYRDWFVLCRRNDEVDNVRAVLDKAGIPNDTFKRSQLNLDSLSEKMEDNTVKVITIHSSKGLENKNVIVIGASRFPRGEEICVNYVAATRAKDKLFWLTPARKQKKKISSWE